MEKIICLVDLEGSSDSALEYAANIARQSNRELVLLNAVEIPLLREAVAEIVGNESPVSELEQESRQRLEPFRKLVQEEYGVTCRILIQADYLNLNKGIAEEVQAGKYKLVVMGTKSAENFRQFVTGVHADHLLKRITAPLLIVPQGLIYRQPDEIAYASDYQSDDAYVVKLTLQLLKGFNPQLTVMHVSHADTGISKMLHQSMRNELEDQLGGTELKFEQIFDREIVSGIHGYMKKSNSDLLVMLSKNYSMAELLIGRHIIEQVNHITAYPTLIIHAPKNDLSENHKGIVL